jgi:hypothetical protein
MMVLFLFGKYRQSFSWQISSPRHRPELSIGFISPNSVFLIHLEFEGVIYVHMLEICPYLYFSHIYL